MGIGPLLLGHRGSRAHRSVRENTFAAFDLSLNHGCDGFEFDVRLSADGAAVICHNPRHRALTIAKTSSAQLRRLPRFEDVIAHYGHRAFLDIELKVSGLGEHVLSALAKHPLKAGYVVSSFLPEVLAEVRELDSTAILGFVCSSKRELRRWRDLSCDYLIPHHRLVTRRLVDEVHAGGKKLISWTVNGRGAMRRLADWGVDGIISDRTDLLARTLKNPVFEE